ncbi:uncharacterized protein LOC107965489 [Apis mellifera]|uniref:Uncharacterized protein LOC107965489 n=1 Tax=Apis mellifera TaxID=7460 RepID=A0A7M7SRT1_APIME|nr:uncharacterized protein LOC107965489 [Apis mellifera]|eukprot:XP_026300975.1 uncharacterized protein LOC107965489 [Apis mellifera]
MLGSDHHRSSSKNIDVIDHTLLLNNPSPVLTWIFLDLSSSSVKREVMGGIPDPEGYGCSTTLCWTKIQPPDDVATRRNEVYRWREAQACDKEERKVASRLVAVLLKPATRELSEILLGFLVSMLRGHACAPFYI